MDAATTQAHRNVRTWLQLMVESEALDVSAVDDTANMLVALVTGLALEAATPSSLVTFPAARKILESVVRSVVSASSS